VGNAAEFPDLAVAVTASQLGRRGSGRVVGYAEFIAGPATKSDWPETPTIRPESV